MSYLAALLISGSAVLLLIAAWGVIKLPDALARQHAATKAGTLALALLCVGAMLAMTDAEWIRRLLLIVVFLLATLPVASHLLARAAVSESTAHQRGIAAARVHSTQRPGQRVG
ncbi:MAG: monovalent cation/H(+) antiporter subunit G [Burkholderiaceae bacterium]|nr:monovalent cation/H(+) antiporter subunit G [Burkholderiaceae bacterium]